MPVNSFRDGSKVWESVAIDYNRIANGLFSYKDANQLNAKWRNILYHARKFGYPHPLESQKRSINEIELLEQVENLRSTSGTSHSKSINNSNSCQDSVPSQDLAKDEIDSPSSNDKIKKIKSKRKNISQSNDERKESANVSSKKKSSLLTLEIHQEKLRMLRETNQIKHSKLLVELERAKVELEKEKYQLAISKYEARKRGLLEQPST